MEIKKAEMINLDEWRLPEEMLALVAKPVARQEIGYYNEGERGMDDSSERRIVRKFAPEEANAYSICRWAERAWFGIIKIQYYKFDKDKFFDIIHSRALARGSRGLE